MRLKEGGANAKHICEDEKRIAMGNLGYFLWAALPIVYGCGRPLNLVTLADDSVTEKLYSSARSNFRQPA
jgi:hypothetical protein